MNDFSDLLWTFNILVVNRKTAYTESEIMKWKKMFCCFEHDFLAGRKEAAKALHTLYYQQGQLEKLTHLHWGELLHLNSLLSDSYLVLFQMAENKIEAAPNGNSLSLVFYM